MVDSLAVSNPAPAENPKSGTGSLKSPKDGGAFYPSAALAYAREDLEIRYQSKDGDVVEVRRSVTVAAAYTSSGARCGAGCGGEKGQQGLQALLAGAPGQADETGEALRKGLKGEMHEAMKWVREVSHELEKQQAKLLEALLKGDGEGKAGMDSRFVMFGFTLVAGKDGEVELGGKDEDYGVPEYWDAENTSDRIVAFATSFAGIFGDDPEFAETMVNAVKEGFKQAGEILGNLPGKAGKLNRDTYDLTFEKLDNWLEAWKAGAYNEEAQNKALEPALAA